ncbi:IucA/IucC family protein [Streptomyces sp. NPDC093085]|uniref:IucA/IucC family protein n=1 Tax=Streptomyces sp. NPDC093085 TaxID=3155068 RepID=UPI00341B78D6
MNPALREAWALAGRRLLVKAVEEFAYEGLFAPYEVDDAPTPHEPPPPHDAPTPHEPPAPGSPRPRPYRLDFGDGSGNRVHWTFRATRGPFATWHIAPDTLTRHPETPAPPESPETASETPETAPETPETASETSETAPTPLAPTPLAPAPPTPEQLLLDARATLRWDGPTTAEALRELTATRRADAEAILRALPAAHLADLGHLELEAHQGGHPTLLLDKGRTGFAASDAAAYAPEPARAVRLTWAAVHRDLARYTALPGLDAERLLAAELDPRTRERFAATLDQACAESSLEAREFVWLPVHPYQWDEAVGTHFTPYLMDGRLVQLGQSADRYRPLRSVRTLANLDRPHRHAVKVPLLIRDGRVWRGLPARPTGAAPEVSRWLREVRDADPYLRDELRFHPLAEVAAVTVRHPLYEAVGDAVGDVADDAVGDAMGNAVGNAVGDAPFPYDQLLGAVWREPVSAVLRERERARTVASLLAEGADGRTLAEELVGRSGLSGREWLKAFFAALLPGLLHHLYRYGVAFRPHGGNTVVLFDGHDIPAGIAVKDFAEGVTVADDVTGTPDRATDTPAPPTTVDPPAPPGTVDAPPASVPRRPPHELAHSLLSTVFAGHFRFFGPLAAERLGVPEGEFWALVRAEVDRYHARFPELAGRFAAYGLLAPEFARATRNRERLGGAAFHGTVTNPLAVPPPPRTVPPPPQEDVEA